MTLPAVYAAAPADLRSAFDNVRKRLADLAEPRLYQTAVQLTVMSRSNRATSWQAWDSPPPGVARVFGRAEIVSAMWSLFGTKTEGILQKGSPVDLQLGNPKRVMLDVLYNAKRDLTLVADNPPGSTSRKDAVRLTTADASWVWAPPGAAASPVSSIVEYNPVNSLGVQNGIGCLYPADVAAQQAVGPKAVYAVPRTGCPKRVVVAGQEPTCSLSAKNQVCGGQGDGEARTATKPRLLAPARLGDKGFLVLPDTVPSLVAQATKNGAKLPLAQDLSLITAWCHADGVGTLNHSRLLGLLGAPGLSLLTSQT